MSDLLNQASLVMIPSGYKEDTVYSQIPQDGSGDLSFTRASNGTRINSAGLVEVCPWNLVEQSNSFNTTWIKNNVTLTSGQTDKDGNANAWKVEFTGGANDSYLFQQLPVGEKTGAVWVKGTAGQTAFIGIRSSVASGSLITFTGNWQQILETTTDVYFVFSNYGAGTATTFFIQNTQANIGATLKPYFPTTDRLNVPRLTYQNGGGGCPSLLLEKQSTNLVSYSQDFTQSSWSKLEQGVGSTSVVTANYAISPDGTQNATRFVCNLNGGSTSSDRSWMIANFSAPATSTLSIWIKLNSAGTKTFVFSNSGGGTKTISGTDWQRIDGTFVGAGGEFRIGLIGGTGSSDTLDCCIWGAQAESGSYPTSYIPTTSSSATRVADACFKTGISSLIGQTEGTIFLDAYFDDLDTVNFSISDGTSGNYVLIDSSSGAVVFARVQQGGVTQATINTSASFYTVGARLKCAIAYKANDFAFYINGTLIGTDNLGTVPACDQIRFARWNGVLPATQRVNEVVISKTRLTNAELASLTTI